ncbi:MAG TPA: V-type ATP synthase subunit A [Tissierellia bacterium]|nr:V-type ATP synthase subunit A [Tissierellia bacterium]
MIGRISSINGPVVGCVDTTGFRLREMVLVGHKRLIGEIIEIKSQGATLQVYEETEGLQLDEPVYPTGKPLHVRLAPGILGHIYDGIQRPLDVIKQQAGDFLSEGIGLMSIDETTVWSPDFIVQEGDQVSPGQIYATLQETRLIEHRLMIPPGVSGRIKAIHRAPATITEEIMVIETESGDRSITMELIWPVRQPRPLKERLAISQPLQTGQRVIDMFFPIGKGGTAAIPGGFGTGKTITQHQIAKWSDADIIVYIGCGERGNEMTDVLEQFRELEDPQSAHKLIERTILIANTSNMPVAAREASIYTGITLAEYYRDMGYHVAIMADSTSRWAEALREISGRLEEIPAEEGYPAYLVSRLAEFYERAGYGLTYSGKEASVTIIGAVSPAGGDFSEPVTENTRRYINAFLALDRKLAYSRHYPAIDWMTSYSGYAGLLERWYEERLGENIAPLRQRMLALLHEESSLREIVQLVGEDVLPDSQRLTLAVARLLRIGYLQQNAFHPVDVYVPLEKQLLMLQRIDQFHRRAQAALAAGVPVDQATDPKLMEELTKMKYDIPNDNLRAFTDLAQRIDQTFDQLERSYRRLHERV